MKAKHLLLFGVAAAAVRAVVRRARMTSLRDKVVVLVGASRGFGLDVARVLVEKGARVVVCARDAGELERAHALVREISFVTCDASDETQVRAFVHAAIAVHGRIDVLITNASNIQVGPVEHRRRDDFEAALQQIFWTTYLPTMAVLPHMRANRRGHLVHVTSFGGRIAAPHLLPYSTAKFAATGFSEGLRAEVAKDGIFVTTVTPGLMRTGSYVNVPFKGQHERELAWFAAGAALPVTSVRSMVAAARLVRAIERRQATATFSLGVRAAVLLKALAPELMARLLALQNRLLPLPKGDDPKEISGAEIADASSSKVVKTIDRLARPNAVAHNERGTGPG